MRRYDNRRENAVTQTPSPGLLTQRAPVSDGDLLAALLPFASGPPATFCLQRGTGVSGRGLWAGGSGLGALQGELPGAMLLLPCSWNVFKLPMTPRPSFSLPGSSANIPGLSSLQCDK